jgi:hypothetical protein
MTTRRCRIGSKAGLFTHCRFLYSPAIVASSFIRAGKVMKNGGAPGPSSHGSRLLLRIACSRH